MNHTCLCLPSRNILIYRPRIGWKAELALGRGGVWSEALRVGPGEGLYFDILALKLSVLGAFFLQSLQLAIKAEWGLKV